MNRYALADGMLQFLNAIAWLFGALSLVAAAVFIADEQASLGSFTGVVGVVSAVTLLALGHVGRAVLDIASNTAQASKPPIITTPPSAPPQVDARQPRPMPEGHDAGLKRWQVLKEVDSEIAEAASRIAAFGPKYEAELADKFTILGDKSYLQAIENLISAKVNNERAKKEALAAESGSELSDSIAQETEFYQNQINKNDGLDPHLKLRVARIEPYAGSWKIAEGGIKVVFEDGSVLLRKGGFRRHFFMDPEKLDVSNLAGVKRENA